MKKIFLAACIAALGIAAHARAGDAGIIKAEEVAEGDTLPAGVFEIDVGAAEGGNPVFLGNILTRQCFTQAYGTPSCVDGSVLRLREINKEGGLDVRPVRLLSVMDGDDVEGNLRAARTLYDDPRIVAVIGPHTSGYARAVIDRILTPAQSGNAGFYSTSATGDGLVTKDGWFFSALWPDTTQARAMARYLAQDKGFRKSVVVTEKYSAYSDSLGAAFRSAFEAVGGKTETIALPSKTDGDMTLEDFAPVVEQIKNSGAEAVYVPCSAIHIARLVRQAGRSGLDPDTVICGGDTWDHSDVFGGGGRLDGCLFTSPLDPSRSDPRLDAFRRAMALSLADVRNITLDTMLSYDTVGMILAAAKAEGATRDGVRRGWLALRDLPLITGDTSVGADGIIRRDICVLWIGATEDGYEAVLLERIPSE
jgi:branched-chain amino acid transport system substrate-binding protein